MTAKGKFDTENHDKGCVILAKSFRQARKQIETIGSKYKQYCIFRAYLLTESLVLDQVLQGELLLDLTKSPEKEKSIFMDYIRFP